MLSLSQSYIHLSLISIFFFSGYTHNKGISKITEPVLIIKVTNKRNKPIKKAKVVLTALDTDIQITAKYDKKKKVYYFDNIPSNYQTVEVFHEKYASKGRPWYDAVSPKKIDIQLIKKNKISKLYNQRKHKYKTKERTDVLLVVLKPIPFSKKIEIQEYANKVFEPLNLKIKTKNIENTSSNIMPPKNFSFYLEKKNKTPFKRFNSVLLQKLRNHENVKDILFIQEDKSIKKHFLTINDIPFKSQPKQIKINWYYTSNRYLVLYKGKEDIPKHLIPFLIKNIEAWGGHCFYNLNNEIVMTDDYCINVNAKRTSIIFPKSIGFGVKDFAKRLYEKDPDLVCYPDFFY